MTGAILAAALLGLAALIWGAAKRGGATRIVVWAGVLIPALIVSACLTSALVEHRFGQVRLTLQALQFEQAGAGVSIGGGTGDLGDDLYIRDSAPGVAHLRLIQAEGVRSLDLEVADPVANQEVVSAVTVNGRFVGAQPFGRGSAICMAACETDQARWSVLAPSGPLRFVPGVRGADGRITATEAADAAGPPLPVRQAFLGIPALRGWRPAQAAHPLRRHLASVAPDAQSVLIQVGAGEAGLDLAGWLGRRWSLLVLDPGVWVAAPGEPAHAVEPLAAIPLLPGDSVALWDVRFGEPAFASQPAGRMQERRSFTVGAAGEGLALRLDTPATLDVADCSRGGLIRREGDLTFPLLGGRLIDAMDLGLPSRCESLRGHAFNFDPEALGGVAPSLILTTFAPPVVPIIAIAVLWSIVVCMVQGSGWGARPTHWMLFCLFQTLLALRLLFAIGGVGADPDLTTSPIIGQALLAYVAWPALFLFLRPGPRETVAWAIGPILFTVAVLASIFLIEGRLPDGLPLAASLGVIGIGVLGLVFRGRIDAALDKPDDGAGAVSVPGEHAWLRVLGVAAVGRLLLGLFSIKERIPGLGVAVSALYTPALIVGFSQLMAEALRSDAQGRLRRGLIFAALVLLTLVLIPLLIKDNGYAIVALPITLVAAWGAFQIWRTHRPDWKPLAVWAAPGVGLVVLLVGLLFGGALAFSNGDRPAEIAAAASASDDAEALRILEQVANESNNRLRIWQRLAPERVEQSGAGEAENLRVISHYLADYTSTWLGRGYLHPQRLGVLTQVQLNDNVSAVHLMGPFGRVSAWALLLLMAIVPMACLRANPAPLEDRAWPEIAAVLSMWILFGVGAYMVLANLQLVPFTGRNLYLLAPASDSDLLEGSTLLTMAYLGLISREMAPRWRAALAALIPARRPEAAS